MRKDLSGNSIKEYQELIDVTLNTHCPSKYVIIDTETGDVWVHNGKTFRVAKTKIADTL